MNGLLNMTKRKDKNVAQNAAYPTG